nr:hypothetical protein OG513_00840 [Streptomyces sp. NBC_00998]
MSTRAGPGTGTGPSARTSTSTRTSLWAPTSPHVLDNPAWAAALADPADPQAWADLRGLVGDGGIASLAGVLTPPDGWETVGSVPGVQLVDTSLRAEPAPEAVRLGPRDVPEILGLLELTKPGPFLPRTVELGTYLGIRHRGRLVAMAGERLRPQRRHPVRQHRRREALHRPGHRPGRRQLKAVAGADYQAFYLSGKVKSVTGLFRSTDCGATWVRIHEDQQQFGGTAVNVIRGDPEVYGRVYPGGGPRRPPTGGPLPRMTSAASTRLRAWPHRVGVKPPQTERAPRGPLASTR